LAKTRSGLLRGRISSNSSGTWLSIDRKSVSVILSSSANFSSSRNCAFVVRQSSMLYRSHMRRVSSQVTISGSLPLYGVMIESSGATCSAKRAIVAGARRCAGGFAPFQHMMQLMLQTLLKPTCAS
jgi:hypothetical protein